MPFQSSRPSSVLVGALAAAGILLTVASCDLAPIGPDGTGNNPPPRSSVNAAPVGSPVPIFGPGQLGSPITLQLAHQEPATPAGGCPVGSIAVYAPAGSPPAGCYRAVGTPLAITSGAVSAVFQQPQPPPPPGQSAVPTQYGFTINVPPGKVSAVTALITKAYDSRDALGISVAGKLWRAPQVDEPFSGQQLDVSFPTKNQALQLFRILDPLG